MRDGSAQSWAGVAGLPALVTERLWKFGFSCISELSHCWGGLGRNYFVGDLHVLLHKEWICTALAALSDQTNFHRQEFINLFFIIKINFQNKNLCCLWLSKSFASTKKDPTGEDPAHPTCQVLPSETIYSSLCLWVKQVVPVPMVIWDTVKKSALQILRSLCCAVLQWFY